MVVVVPLVLVLPLRVLVCHMGVLHFKMPVLMGVSSGKVFNLSPSTPFGMVCDVNMRMLMDDLPMFVIVKAFWGHLAPP